APALSGVLVRLFLDLPGFRLPDKRFARHRVPHRRSSYPLNLLPRSANAISWAVAVGISSTLRSDRGPMAHLGRMAFSPVFSLPDELGVARSSARTYR